MMKGGTMPSYDLVSKIDSGEMKNVIAMTQKEISSRFDFKNSNTTIELTENTVELDSSDEEKLKTALSVLREKMIKRNIGMRALEPQDIRPSGNMRFKQTLNLKNGIDKDSAKKITKIIKDSGMKVKAQIMDDKVRVEGKQIDELQEVYHMLKGHKDVSVELQMENMKR